MPERNDNFLSIRDLKVEYRSGGKTICAVNGVSFDLKKGASLGLLCCWFHGAHLHSSRTS